jgi:hypothetical protein
VGVRAVSARGRAALAEASGRRAGVCFS